MNRKICLMLTVVLCLSVVLCSCGDKKDNTSSNEVINVVSQVNSNEVSSESLQDENSNSENSNVIFELSEEFTGDWQVASVYQEVRVSEMTSDEGLAEEKKHAIHIDSDFYEGCDFHLTNPLYKIEEVSSSVLSKEYGFNAENIKNDFGEKVKMLTVEDGDGLELGTSVYFLKGDNLIRCGTGAHLYLCKKVQAVG